MQDTTDAYSSAGLELFVGYVPAFRRVGGWRPVFRQERQARRGIVVRRVVWDCATDHRESLLVAVTEAPTEKAARERLEAARQERSGVTFAAPGRLGTSAFVAPQENPWCAEFSRANLHISIVSCGEKHVLVLPWVYHILDELDEKETKGLDPDLKIVPATEPGDVSGVTRLNFRLPWDRGHEAWWKFTVSGGRLARALEGNRLMLWPDPGPKVPVVTGWAMEPGRETYWGQYPSYSGSPVSGG